jgi:hypothetical protein
VSSERPQFAQSEGAFIVGAMKDQGEPNQLRGPHPERSRERLLADRAGCGVTTELGTGEPGRDFDALTSMRRIDNARFDAASDTA